MEARDVHLDEQQPAGRGLRRLLDEPVPVEASGQLVGMRDPFEPRGRRDGLGHVAHEADVVRGPARRIADGFEVEIVPEQAAVLAIVPQPDSGRRAGRQSLAHRGDVRLQAVAPLQVPAVLADRLLPRITGHRLEGRVDVDEPRIGGAHVADENALLRPVHDRGQHLSGKGGPVPASEAGQQRIDK